MTKHIRMFVALFGALTAATAVAADDVVWNIVSGTHGGHSDRYQSVFVVYFLADSDFGKSYTVSANLTWPVTVRMPLSW